MKRLLFISALSVALLQGCTVYQEYPIEVYKPGETNIPSSARNVALIYRNFKYDSDTLQHFYKKNSRLVKEKNDPQNMDSLLVQANLNNLATQLKQNNTFDNVHIFPYNSFERHSGDHLAALPPELTQKITAATTSDLLISLETFSYFFSTWQEASGSPKNNEVITIAVWGIYDAGQADPLERKTMIDTIYWNGYDEQGNTIRGYHPPPRLEALKIASALAGENYGKRFHASWETVSRMYSIPPLPDFSEAAYYFEEGNLDRAIALWKKYADENNGKLSINARYNLALAYEMKDDIETAEKWLNAASQTAQTYRSKSDLQMIRTYQNALATRKKEINRLNDQN